VSWKEPLSNDCVLPEQIQFGDSLFSQKYLNNLSNLSDEDYERNILDLYCLMREEIVILMERLRVLYLESKIGLDAIKPLPGFGEASNRCQIYQEKVRRNMEEEEDAPISHNTLPENMLRKGIFECENYSVAYPSESYNGFHFDYLQHVFNHSLVEEEQFNRHIESLYRHLYPVAVSNNSSAKVCKFKFFLLYLLIKILIIFLVLFRKVLCIPLLLQKVPTLHHQRIFQTF
jgi:hypothetical protein